MRDDDRFAGSLQVTQNVSPVTIADDGSGRNLDHQLFTTASKAV
jgi:hypothetical protein